MQRRQERSLLLLSLFLVAGVISAILVVANSAINVARWWDETVRWKDEEYDKLAGLRAGFAVAAFDDALGTPVFVRETRAGLQERIYRGRDHWVQAIASENRTVALYAVVSCDEEFQPRFQVEGEYTQGAASGHITLQRTAADRVFTGDEAEYHIDLDVFISGATLNTRVLNVWYGGNPSFYKTYVWGYTDGCEVDADPPADISDLPTKDLVFDGPLVDASPALRGFNSFPVNTFAEVAHGLELKEARGRFQVGPDRILTRTARGP